MSEPKTMSEYMEWANLVLADDLSSDTTRRIYDTNVAMALSAIQQTPFSRELTDLLAKASRQYYEKTGSRLRMDDSQVEFAVKPYMSAVNKLFRLNVIWNRSFPNPPPGGWVTSQNVYSRLDDLIRATIVCKFLDGPEFLAETISSFASAHNRPTESRRLERDDGYYAFHVYTSFDVELTDSLWAVKTHSLKAEIQITTQLQELLRELTHRSYEKVRLERQPDRKNWKWQIRDPRFRAGFLSHSLHMIEGLILELRDDARNSSNG